MLMSVDVCKICRMKGSANPNWMPQNLFRRGVMRWKAHRKSQKLSSLYRMRVNLPSVSGPLKCDILSNESVREDPDWNAQMCRLIWVCLCLQMPFCLLGPSVHVYL